jgi:hypothetical protein
VIRRAAICISVATAALAAAPPAIASAETPSSQPSCEKRVSFALVDARTSGCLEKVSSSPDTWESSDVVTLNGIPLPPLPGTKLVLKGPTAAAPGGSVAVKTTITLSGTTVFTGSFSYNLPAGGPGELKTLASVSPPSGTKIKGLSLGGSATIQLGKDAGGEQQGYARFELVVALPDVFRNGPSKTAGGLTGTVAIRTDASGVHADALKIEVTNAYVGQVLLKNVCLSYVAGTSPVAPCAPPKFGATQLLSCTNATGVERWDGSALITLPTAARPDLGVFAGTTEGKFAYAGAQVTNLGTSAPLAPGVYLDRVGIGVCLNPPPLKIKGSVGIRFGPDFNGKQAAYLSGSMEYIDSSPWLLKAVGNLSLFEQNVANGSLTYRSDGAIDFGFEVNWNLYSVLELTGGVNGWYQPSHDVTSQTLDLRDPLNQRRYSEWFGCFFNLSCILNPSRRAAVQAEFLKIPRITETHTVPAKFDVFGHGRVCAIKIVCTGGEVAVSSVGAAGCAELTVFGYPEPYWLGVRWVDVTVRAGAGYRWGNGGHVDVMGNSCDVGGYRAQKGAVISAHGATTIRIARQPAVAVRVQGAGAPPRITLKSPTGETIVASGPGQLQPGHYDYVQDPQTNATSVVIAEPAEGRWKIRALPGSSRIVGVATAPVDPEPSAAGRVIGGGTRRALEYVVESDPAHQITFFERGASYEQELGPAVGRPCLQNAPITGTRPKNAFVTRPHLFCGVIPFAPTDGPPGKRDIVAVVSDHGDPVRERPVTSYEVGPEPLPTEPTGLHVVRHGTTAVVTWAESLDAVNYDINVRVSDGEDLLRIKGTNQRRVVLHHIPRRATLTVSVAGLRSDDVPGPAAQVRSRGRR